ncbi:MAG: potassium channel protein [Sulfuricurvum sp.]|uniref:potassium channel family protein n=1 Tax=Sulfuricurvum sp. TaxID=2025608 RepID=UPI002735E4DD|nr:potassium channel protein [Sulfuricurvum sp.]MDP2849736.1 potassium channel protein [Sulfuricurvum sp.]MDP3290799.1 potassium channel protein [Sulfuricurvum sp.]
MNLIQKLQKFLNWEPSPKPDITLNAELYAQFLPFRTPLILIQLCMIFGTLGYMYIEGHTLINALFQTGYTFTTVGFGSLGEGEFSPLGKLFTITLIIFGFAVFTLAIGIIVDVINRGELKQILKERKMLYRIARLKKHFVICYHNEYAVQVTKQLRANQIPFVVIDPREDMEALAKQYKYPYYIQAEPHTEEAMLKAHLSSAKGLITLSSSIADNIALIASVRLFEKEHKIPAPYYVISSAEGVNDIDKLKKLGSDTVVSPTKLTAQRITAMAARPDMENLLEQFLYKSDTPLDMEEIFVPKTSWMVLKKLKETHLRDIANVSVIGITKKDGKMMPMPKGDVLVMSESKLLVIGTQKGILFTKALVKKQEKPEELKYV